jgi:serine protease Do
MSLFTQKFAHKTFVLGICSCLISLGSLTTFQPAFSQTPAILEKTSQDFIGVGKTAIPAVVSIQVKSIGTDKSRSRFQEYDPSDEDFQGDFFGKFFGIPKPDKQRGRMQVTQGSGFIVSSDGHIMTNSHVIRDPGKITVILNDEREFPGKIIGQDESTDVAIIKIDAKDLPYLKLGNSDALEVGQWVVAIGTPFGLQASLSAGIVSAKGRNNLDIAKIEDFIQTDAPLNQGNSGGPLLNLNSEVIGINTAIATTLGSAGYLGIGFAIPSNMAKHVMEQLIATGTITRGQLGVVLQPIDSDLAQGLGLKEPFNEHRGVLIAEVLQNSAADKAGLKTGDVLLKLNGNPIESVGALRNFVALQKPGTKITLTLIRSKQMQDVTVEIGAQTQTESGDEKAQTKSALGFDVQTLTPELAKSLNLPDEGGVIVTKVDPSSPASLVGIKKGAVILAVNQVKVDSKEEFEQQILQNPPEKPFLFLIRQGGVMRYISLRVDSVSR